MSITSALRTSQFVLFTFVLSFYAQATKQGTQATGQDKRIANGGTQTLSDSYSLHTIDKRNGLPSMFVLSVYQDQYGFIWAGTYDGLCVLDGNGRQTAGYMSEVLKCFNGCIIDAISGDESGHVWIHSNFGLDMYDRTQNRLEHHPEIRGSYRFCVSAAGDVVVLTKDKGFFYYNSTLRTFELLPLQDISLRDVRSMDFISQHTVVIYTQDQVLNVELTRNGGGTLSTHLTQRTTLPCQLRHAFTQQGEMYLIDVDDNLYTCCSDGSSLHMVARIDALRGRSVSSIIRLSSGHLMASFFQDGCLDIRIGNDGEVRCQDTALEYGVISALKDRGQDIIWLATDGDGIKFLARDTYNIYYEQMSELPFGISAPVRSIIRDQCGHLWVATKGDGLLCYRSYQPFGKTPREAEHWTSGNSPLLHNSVYHFSQGSHGVVWIASEAMASITSTPQVIG